MKNILIISYIYPPYNAPAARRPYSWAKYLDKSKYDVTVLTCSNPDSSLGMDSSMDNTLPDVTLLKIKSALNSNVGSDLRDANLTTTQSGVKTKLKQRLVKVGSYFLIPDKAIFWYANVKKYLKNNKDLLEAIDVVITTSPAMTNHLLGMRIKRKYPNIKLIGDIRDYHYIGAHKVYSPWPLSLFHRKFEKNILRKADKITFISNAMRDMYKEHYKKEASKFSVIYNGFDPDDFTIEKSNHSIGRDKIRIFYAGSFYGGIRSPKGLLQLLDWGIEEGLLTLEDFEITIAGNFESDLQDKMATYTSYKNVNYIGKISRNEVIEYYQNSSILWLIVGEQLIHYTGVPLKFYEYLAAHKYIINFAPSTSEPTSLIDRYDLGTSIDINNEDKTVQLAALSKILNTWRSQNLSRSNVKEALETFDRKNQTQLLENIIDEL